MNKFADFERMATAMRKVDVANEIHMYKTMIKALKIRIDAHWNHIKELKKEYNELKKELEDGPPSR